MSKIEKTIGYIFRDTNLLSTALRHSSYAHEHPADERKDNERLEFLGDAALSLCISDLLMQHFSTLPEGALSQIRAHLVNEPFLADKARRINLGEALLLGKGEELSQGHDKDSILSGAYEALLGAVYADGGFTAIFQVVKEQFAEDLTETAPETLNADYKSLLQEFLQKEYKSAPFYQIISETGPDHDKTFFCRVTAADITTVGTGKNKKSAQQAAAREALQLLKNRE